MNNLIRYLQVIPIILITFYIGFYFLIEYQIYSDLHYDYLKKLDNIFVVISLIVFVSGGYKIWNKIAIKSFITVILLNIITEIKIDNYYETYSILVQLFLITLIVTQIPKKLIWNQRTGF